MTAAGAAANGGRHEDYDDAEINDADLAMAEETGFVDIDDFDEVDLTSVERNSIQNTQQPAPREPRKLANGKWACNHQCKDKRSCKHTCCREGMDNKPKAPKPRQTQKQTGLSSSTRQTQLDSMVSKGCAIAKPSINSKTDTTEAVPLGPDLATDNERIDRQSSLKPARMSAMNDESTEYDDCELPDMEELLGTASEIEKHPRVENLDHDEDASFLLDESSADDPNSVALRSHALIRSSAMDAGASADAEAYMDAGIVSQAHNHAPTSKLLTDHRSSERDERAQPQATGQLQGACSETAVRSTVGTKRRADGILDSHRELGPLDSKKQKSAKHQAPLFDSTPSIEDILAPAHDHTELMFSAGGVEERGRQDREPEPKGDECLEWFRQVFGDSMFNIVT